MVVYIWTKSAQHKKNMKSETNVVLDNKNTILHHKIELYDRRDELKQNMIVSEENEFQYVTTTRAVCLTSTHTMGETVYIYDKKNM